jgi:hypothetical protein
MRHFLMRGAIPSLAGRMMLPAASGLLVATSGLTD